MYNILWLFWLPLLLWYFCCRECNVVIKGLLYEDVTILCPSNLHCALTQCWNLTSNVESFHLSRATSQLVTEEHSPLVEVTWEPQASGSWPGSWCVGRVLSAEKSSRWVWGNDLTLGCQTSHSASSSNFHHWALLVALVSHSSNFHHWPLLALLVALMLH